MRKISKLFLLKKFLIQHYGDHNNECTKQHTSHVGGRGLFAEIEFDEFDSSIETETRGPEICHHYEEQHTD